MTFVRYLVIQLLAYAIDLGAFMLALKLGWLGPIAANLVSKSAAGYFAFTAHRHFTFGIGHQAAQPGQVLRYVMLLGFNLVFSSAVLALLLRWIAFPSLAKIATDTGCVLITFFLSKHFIFVTQAARNDAPTDRGGVSK